MKSHISNKLWVLKPNLSPEVSYEAIFQNLETRPLVEEVYLRDLCISKQAERHFKNEVLFATIERYILYKKLPIIYLIPISPKILRNSSIGRFSELNFLP